MNREQAGNMLDAYVLLSTANTKAASDALLEWLESEVRDDC